MSSQFQNRLVGVIVIVALGVIFLPDILDGKKQREEEQFAEIPLRPEIEQSSLSEQDNLPDQDINSLDLGEGETADSNGDDSWHIAETEEANEAQSAAKAPATESAKVTEKVVAKTEAKPQPKPVTKPSAAWTIQLGSFNNAANVKGLVNRLRAKGFTAYTLPTKPVDGQLTKVFVGPNISKDKLSRMQNDIYKLTELKGRIVAYNPVEK
ncbi:cell division protein DedD [Shewanella pneumatophori]|uniref:Cell division protein DedD n=1 Tax=Shewanella pneumatophori TaxID=314092 RepID=A0A9X2CDJ6_9GAMM|nr:cell division protein DedD [Shewanella pneumatophori]MCL1139248.1 cell division protein DedD [Shewanella pneumatophori]